MQEYRVGNGDQITYRHMRSSLRKYLNTQGCDACRLSMLSCSYDCRISMLWYHSCLLGILYQARIYLTKHAPLLAILLQVVLRKFAAVFRNTLLEAKMFAQGNNVLVFLVVYVSFALMAERNTQLFLILTVALKEEAKSLHISLLHQAHQPLVQFSCCRKGHIKRR